MSPLEVTCHEFAFEDLGSGVLPAASWSPVCVFGPSNSKPGTH